MRYDRMQAAAAEAERFHGGPHGAAYRTDEVVYEQEIPAFAGAELDRLYGTMHSSLAWFETAGGLDGASTYVARRGGDVSALFLFRREGRKVRVINEGMRVPAEEICRFARRMFDTDPSLWMVEFHAVQPDGDEIALPHQRFFCAEDFIARLPESQDAFLSRLGPATRKNLKRHRNRLERDFPDFGYRIHERQDAREADIRAIIELNRRRMEAKGTPTYIDEQETRRIVALVRRCGAALVAKIDGKICGGTLMYRIGSSHLSKVNAHDPAFDDYRLGMLCCFLAISEAIACGAKYFHLGHSHYDYKTALLGEFQAFDHIAIYRSGFAALGCAGDALKVAKEGYRLRGRRWLTDNAGRNDSTPWRLVRRVLDLRRAMKRRLGRPG